ncbi:MAG: hypothetical protein DRO39_05075 [Thermoprotei archaeon]|nr:MAG: hypothetical protein DRO39_05075 [Thermoprotei archaeon]
MSGVERLSSPEDELEEIFRRINELRRRIESFVEEAVRRSLEGTRRQAVEALRPLWSSEGVLEPLYSVRDTGREYVVYVDLPYANEGTIDVKFIGNEMVIEARLKSEVAINGWHKRYQETKFHSYRAVVKLPVAPDPRRVRIRVRKGVIQVVIPKD